MSSNNKNRRNSHSRSASYSASFSQHRCEDDEENENSLGLMTKSRRSLRMEDVGEEEGEGLGSNQKSSFVGEEASEASVFSPFLDETGRHSDSTFNITPTPSSMTKPAHRRSLTFACGDVTPVPHCMTPRFETLVVTSVTRSKRRSDSGLGPGAFGRAGRAQSSRLATSRNRHSTGGSSALHSPAGDVQTRIFTFPAVGGTSNSPSPRSRGVSLGLLDSAPEDREAEEDEDNAEEDHTFTGEGDTTLSAEYCPEDHIPAPENPEGLAEEDGLSYEELQETVADLREKLLHAAELGQHLLDKKEELEQDIETAVQESWHYKTENKGLWEKIAEQANEITQLRGANIKLEAKNRELVGENMGPKDLSELAVPHSPLRPTIPEYKKQWEDAQAELKISKLELAGLKAHISKLEGKLDESEMEKNALSRRISSESNLMRSSMLGTPQSTRKRHRVRPSMGAHGFVLTPPTGSSSDNSPAEPTSRKPHSALKLTETPVGSSPSLDVALTKRRQSDAQAASNVTTRKSYPTPNVPLHSNSPEPSDQVRPSLDSIESFGSTPPTSQINSPLPLSLSAGDPSHRRGGGLGRKSAASETHRSAPPSISHKEFDIIMEQARKYEEKRASQLHNPDGELKEDDLEEEDTEEEQDFYEAAYVEKLMGRIQSLEEDIEELHTIVGAQRSQIRQYRENEKAHYVFTSMNSGEYSNLAKELELSEKGGDDALSVIEEEQSRASSNTSSSRGGSSRGTSRGRGHRRGTPTHSTMSSPSGALGSGTSETIYDEATELGPQQRDINQGKLKSRPGNTPPKTAPVRQSRLISRPKEPHSGHYLPANSPDSVREVEISSSNSAASSIAEQAEKVYPPPPILVQPQVVIQSGYDDLFSQSMKAQAPQMALLGPFRSPLKAKTPNLKTGSHEIVREIKTKGNVEADDSEHQLGLKSIPSIQHMKATNPSEPEKPNAEMLLYGDVMLAEELQKEKKINASLEKELKKARLQLHKRRIAIWTLVGISCVILAPSILSTFSEQAQPAQTATSFYTQRFVSLKQKALTLNVVNHQNVVAPSNTTSSRSGVIQKCCCPPRKEEASGGSKSNLTLLDCSPQCLPIHCRMTKKVLETVNIPFHICKFVNKVASFLAGY